MSIIKPLSAEKLRSLVNVALGNEKADLATDHCEVGHKICHKWNFSPLIQEGVLRHHTPLIDGNFSFPGSIIFMSHFLSGSDPSGEIISTFSPATKVLSNMNLTPDDFIKARKEYKSRIGEITGKPKSG